VFNTVSKQVCTTLVLLSALVAYHASAAVDDESLIDPTRPLMFVPVSAEGEGNLFGLFDEVLASNYELSSILIRSSSRIAVINDERVRVDDRIGSATVAAIESDHVVLNVSGEMQTLKLYPNSIKTLVKGDE
jgi:hypothetical protein